uniref:Uncharacterized protein n=1 Tax=Onchocerca volvulus TaxID=6282 RepID=A0A8R1TRE8_ONCVO
MSYTDKILEIVEKLTEQNDNPCTTYLIEEFNDKVTFGKLLSKPEIIGELRKIFHDMKPTSDINITNAIESFRKIPWSSQITNILFVPDEAMYRNQEIYESDMKSAKDLLKQMAIENPISAPRIVIGNPVYFQDIHSSVRAYSSDMNVDKLTEAILLALQDEESKMPEIFTSTISNKEDATLPSSIAETLSTTSWIRDTTQEQKISTLVDKNIDSTPVSSDLSGTIECTTIRTFNQKVQTSQVPLNILRWLPSSGIKHKSKESEEIPIESATIATNPKIRFLSRTI